MELNKVIEAINLALVNMDQNYCKLSIKDYNNIESSDSEKENLKKEKYLERPVAYDFYHQLRSLLDEGKVDFGGPIIQAEVNKKYQHCFKNGKIPDFLIHIPNFNYNLAVIEFKLATRAINEIRDDIVKIVEFKTNNLLHYSYGIEILLGEKNSLESCRRDIENWNKNEGEEIIIIEFDLDSWKTDLLNIKFKE